MNHVITLVVSVNSFTPLVIVGSSTCPPRVAEGTATAPVGSIGFISWPEPDIWPWSIPGIWLWSMSGICGFIVGWVWPVSPLAHAARLVIITSATSAPVIHRFDIGYRPYRLFRKLFTKNYTVFPPDR